MHINSIKYIQHDDLACSFNIFIQDKPTLTLRFNQPVEKDVIGDCVVLLLLFQAMEEGQAFSMPGEYPVSAALYENVSKLQNIFSRWYSQLQIIPLNVAIKNAQNTQNQTNEGKTLSFFSGGVDSFYTFIKNKHEISHLFLCLGLDIQLKEKDKLEKATSYYGELAKEFNKKLLIAEINIREVFPKFNSEIQHSAILSGLSLMFGAQRILVPASSNMDQLVPWGSHPLTDPLFSNDLSCVEHDNMIYRSEKMEYLRDFPNALNELRVCNSSDQYNCGCCEKCLRTMFALKVLKCSSNSMPSIDDHIEQLKKLKIYHESEWMEWEDNLSLARRHKDTRMEKYANKVVRNYNFRLWVKQGLRLLR